MDEPKPKKRRKPTAQRKKKAFKNIDLYVRWCEENNPRILRVTVALTEKYTRYILGLRASDPLLWRGRQLDCIGSPAVRENVLRARTTAARAHAG